MSTLCTIDGPGLALRGPEGSMKVAVDGLKVEQVFIAKFFGAGMFFFHVSALMYAWVAFPDWSVVILLTVMLSIFILMFMSATGRIMKAFEIPDSAVVSGAFGVQDSLYGENEMVKRRRSKPASHSM